MSAIPGQGGTSEPAQTIEFYDASGRYVGYRKVYFEELKATLGEVGDNRPERYSFTWAGKRDTIRSPM